MIFCLRLFLFFLLWIIGANAKKADVIADDDYASLPPIFELDDWDLCMLHGKDAFYCSVTIQLAPTDPKPFSKPWQTIEVLNRSPKNYRHDRLRYGICVPSTCPSIPKNLTENDEQLKIELSAHFTERFKKLGLKTNVTEMHCENNRNQYQINYIDMAVASFLVAYLFFVVFCSFYEGLARYKPKDEYNKTVNTAVGQVLAAFSIPKNYYRLTASKDTQDHRALKFIQGIRFYNMICVILSHTCMTIMAGPISNTKFVENMTSNPFHAFIYNGSAVVQTFFAISGWLLSYHFFLLFERHRKVRLSYVIWAFVNRYIRLTPTLALLVAFHSTWLVHMGRGPVWDFIVGTEYRNCRKNWWTNILYINNYYDSENMCMQQTWYLATDMQALLVSLVLIVLIWQYRNHTKSILGVAVVIAVAIPGVINYIYQYDIVYRIYPELLYHYLLKEREWHTSFGYGHTHLGGYTMGLALGYLFYKYRGKNVINKKTVYVVLWWFLSLILPALVLLSAWFMYQDGFTCTRFGSAVYMSLNRNTFALCICLLMFGITQGEGWFMKWFCEWKPVQVLGKLTFTAYLGHLAMMKTKAGLTRHPVYLKSYLIIIRALGDVTTSYMAAFVLCLLFEMPVSALQKMLMPKNAQKTKTPAYEKSLALLGTKENSVE